MAEQIQYTGPNQGIWDYLNEYVLNPDPQYAVFINGQWGCGKTYFVKNWIAHYDGQSAQDDRTLRPICVSLYGLKQTSQITDAINRELYPMLHGRAAKIGKSILKVVSKIALHTDLDINQNGTDDIGLDMSLDALSFLKSDDDEIKSDKLIVFDDLERCLIPNKELLGYINYFVEQCHAHVIIVGDEPKLGESLDDFHEFKEKTIGREFVLETEIEAALVAFLEEVPCIDFLKESSMYIQRLFKLSQSNNLRILRQAIYDFKRQLQLMNRELDESQLLVVRSLMFGFIATYLEYKGAGHDDIEKFLLLPYGEEKNKVKDRLIQLNSKYDALRSYSLYDVMSLSYIGIFVEYIKSGRPLTTFLESAIFPVAKIRPSWEQLHDWIMMSNPEFTKTYNLVLKDIRDKKIPDIRTVGSVIVWLCFFDARGIKTLSGITIKRLQQAVVRFLNEANGAEELYKLRSAYFDGINTLMTREELPKLKLFSDFFNPHFDKLKESKKNKMIIALENLTDSVAKTLIDLAEESMPDHSCTFDMTPMFTMVDTKKVFEGIKLLSNDGRSYFNSFIRNRYKLSYSLGGAFSNFKGEHDNLWQLHELCEKEAKRQKMIIKESYVRLASSFDQASQRANGATNPFG